jgi:threonine synthase
MNTTPIFAFPSDSPYANIFIKREDLSETGSHKFRYLKTQLERLKQEGIDKVVISTTGNAGITASHYAKPLGIKVFCLMSDQGDMNKAAQIEREGGFLVISRRARRYAEYISKQYNIPLLRTSRDQAALDGYRSLGEEILTQVPKVKAIVNFASSGTSSIGLFKAFENQTIMPAVHLACHSEQRNNPREESLQTLVKKTSGQRWEVSQEEVANAEKILKKYGLETGFESLCSFAVALKVKELYLPIAVIFSGKKWPEVDFQPQRSAATLQDIGQHWQQFTA